MAKDQRSFAAGGSFTADDGLQIRNTVAKDQRSFAAEQQEGGDNLLTKKAGNSFELPAFYIVKEKLFSLCKF